MGLLTQLASSGLRGTACLPLPLPWPSPALTDAPAPGDVGGAALLAPSAPKAEGILCSPDVLPINLCSFLVF